jgi:hypothetical protein
MDDWRDNNIATFGSDPVGGLRKRWADPHYENQARQ